MSLRDNTHMGVAGGQGRTGREVAYYGTSIALGAFVLFVTVVIAIVKVTQ